MKRWTPRVSALPFPPFFFSFSSPSLPASGCFREKEIEFVGIDEFFSFPPPSLFPSFPPLSPSGPFSSVFQGGPKRDVGTVHGIVPFSFSFFFSPPSSSLVRFESEQENEASNREPFCFSSSPFFFLFPPLPASKEWSSKAFSSSPPLFFFLFLGLGGRGVFFFFFFTSFFEEVECFFHPPFVSFSLSLFFSPFCAFQEVCRSDGLSISPFLLLPPLSLPPALISTPF